MSLSDFFTDQKLGPKTDNMGPPISQIRETGGVDYLVFQCFGSFSSYDSLRTGLESAKVEAQAGGDGWLALGSGSCRVQVRPNGSGRFENAAKWGFTYYGVHFWLMDRPNSGDGKPLMRVELTSMPLMQLGLRGCLEIIEKVFKWIGFEYFTSKVTRVDLCADVTGIAVGEFFKKFVAGHVVRSTTKFSIYGDGGIDDIQTLCIGGSKNPIKMRCYDKIAELSGQQNKEQVFLERRARGCLTCTRVEFEVKRDALRDTFKISSVEELLRNLGTIAKRLTSEWFRFTEGKVDRTHTTRAEVWDKWQTVIDCFNEWISQVGQQETREPVKLRQDSKKKLAALRGYWVSMMADAGFLPRTIEEGIEFLWERLDGDWRDLQQAVKDKAHKIANIKADDCITYFENKKVPLAGRLFA